VTTLWVVAIVRNESEASNRMRRQRERDTLPEIVVRRHLHRAGLRFRVAVPVPGRSRRSIDIAFTRLRIAVFVDGCFWHRCPAHGTSPRTNGEWWNAKLERNVERDLDTNSALVAAGWRVIRVWEHEARDAAVLDRLIKVCRQAAG
jgi:DNA mismatch endonuclease, patch repair protein